MCPFQSARVIFNLFIVSNILVADDRADRAIACELRCAEQKPALLVGDVAWVFVAVFGLLAREHRADGPLGGTRIGGLGSLATDLQVVKANPMASIGIAVGFGEVAPSRIDGQ